MISTGQIDGRALGIFAALRRLGPPPGVVARARWLYLCCVNLALLLTLPAPLIGATPPTVGLGVHRLDRVSRLMAV